MLMQKARFDIESIWDFSADQCLRYTNFIIPFWKIIELTKIEDTEIWNRHISLGRKFVESQKKVNSFIDFWKTSIKKIDQEMWEYMSKEKTSDVTTFSRTNPSWELDEKFRECIESLSMRLQDVSRVCLSVIDKEELFVRWNLVNAYEDELKEIYKNNTSILDVIKDDKQRVKMLKELRNEAGRHAEWDRRGIRELIFHPIKVDVPKNWSEKPKFQIPWYEFTWTQWTMRIDDFDTFFETLTHNIYDISIDRLIFAYAHKWVIDPWILKSLFQWKEIKEV